MLPEAEPRPNHPSNVSQGLGIFKMAAIKHAKTYGFSPNPCWRGVGTNCLKIAGIFSFFSSNN